jgi:hypothetical protein
MDVRSDSDIQLLGSTPQYNPFSGKRVFVALAPCVYSCLVSVAQYSGTFAIQ